jgi:Zn-dependent M28 family amino/carboxypeptidase
MTGGKHHPGADDNASGVSMMLETAREIAEMPIKPRRSVVFVGFDLEERLLWGSRWFAAHPPWDLQQVKLFITADMIGRSLGDLPLPTVFVLGAERAPALKIILDEVECPDNLEILRLGADLIGTRSDYGPFRDRQVPFLFFSTGEHGDYHTPRDTPDRVDCEKVSRVSTLILRVALWVANEDVTPEWTDVVSPDLDEARAVHRITELVLDADTRGDHQLNGFQRLFVGQVHAKTGNAIRLGRLSTPERVWLTRAAQLLLLSVF